MEKELKVRIPQKIDTTSNWENSTLVLKQGEIGIEKTTDGGKKIKIGDGVNIWNNLDYLDEEKANLNQVVRYDAEQSLNDAQKAQARSNIGAGTLTEHQDISGKANVSDLTAHTGNKSNPHNVTKNQVGLGSVTNHAQVKRTEMGTANGVATLDASGKIPSSQLPSYVDDVIEGADTSEFPTTGENGKIYIDLSTNKIYRWSGSTYVVISETLTLGETSSTAYAGNKGKANADAITAIQTKLNGIASGAEKNVQSDWNVTSTTSDAFIKNKPTKLSQFENDSKFLTSHQDISGKADLDQVVRHDIEQSLTSEQKIQARNNIGAGTSNFNGDYNSLDNKPTIPDISGLAPKANTLAGYGIGDAYTKTQTNSQITTKIQGLDKTDTAVSGQYVSAVSETNGIITVTRADLPSQTDYTVEVVESTPSGYAKAYTITQAASGLNATINIPKDMVVESGRVETKTSSGAWGLAGTYLVLTLANATNDVIYIDVSTLIEYVTSGSGANDAIQIAVNGTTHKITASIKEGSIAKDRLDSGVQASLTKADKAVTDVSGKANLTQVVRHDVAQSLNNTQKTQARTNIGAATTGNYTGSVTTTWSGTAAPFTQNVAISGIVAADSPIIDLVPSTTNYIVEEAEWNKIIKAEAYAGGIKFYAKEKTTTALSIKVKVVR